MQDTPKSFSSWFPFIFIPIVILVAFFLWTISQKISAIASQPSADVATSIVKTDGQSTTLQTLSPQAAETTVLTPPESQSYILPSLSQGLRGLITNGNRGEYKVGLTFDVCQAEGELSGYDSKIVSILTETQTPATFFLGGEWIRDHESNARELANNPLFQLGNHSWSHLDFSQISSEQMTQEITLTQDMLYKLTGKQNNLFRLPYGFYNDQAFSVIGDEGLYTIQWDVVSGDPDPNIYAPAMSDWVLQQVQPGSIIIMHANGRGWHTAEALPGIIQALHDKGYTLVTISELLNIPRP